MSWAACNRQNIVLIPAALTLGMVSGMQALTFECVHVIQWESQTFFGRMDWLKFEALYDLDFGNSPFRVSVYTLLSTRCTCTIGGM